MKFVCDYNIPCDEAVLLKLKFTIRNTPFEVKGVVLRKEEAKDGFYGYGIKFSEISEEQKKKMTRILNKAMMFHKVS